MLFWVWIKIYSQALHHGIGMEITKTKFFECCLITSWIWVYGTCNYISSSISLLKDFPKFGLLTILLHGTHEKVLSRSSIDVIQSFSGSTHFRSLVTSTDLSPGFFDQLHLHLSFTILELSSLILCEAKLLNSISILIKWEPIIDNHN